MTGPGIEPDKGKARSLRLSPAVSALHWVQYPSPSPSHTWSPESARSNLSTRPEVISEHHPVWPKIKKASLSCNLGRSVEI